MTRARPPRAEDHPSSRGWSPPSASARACARFSISVSCRSPADRQYAALGSRHMLGSLPPLRAVNPIYHVRAARVRVSRFYRPAPIYRRRQGWIKSRTPSLSREGRRELTGLFRATYLIAADRRRPDARSCAGKTGKLPG